MRRLLFAFLLALGLVAGTVGFPLAASYTFETIDVPGGSGTQARGINNRGQIVGGYCGECSGGEHGFLDDNGIFTQLDVPFSGVIQTHVSGINDDGQIVGFYVDANFGRHGFLLAGGTFTPINVPFPGGSGTAASGINNRGDIVGQYYDPQGNNHGFLLSGGTFTPIDVPGCN